MRKSITKREAQKKHAIRRAGERYNLPLSKSLRLEFISKIQSGDRNFVIKHEDRILKVVYDKNRKMLVTFLPCKLSVEDFEQLKQPLAEEPKEKTWKQKINIASKENNFSSFKEIMDSVK